jgi:hypothetical protein
MTAGDMLRSVVPVYPPEGSDVVRAGSLPGEPSPHVQQDEVGCAALRVWKMSTAWDVPVVAGWLLGRVTAAGGACMSARQGCGACPY